MKCHERLTANKLRLRFRAVSRYTLHHGRNVFVLNELMLFSPVTDIVSSSQEIFPIDLLGEAAEAEAALRGGQGVTKPHQHLISRAT